MKQINDIFDKLDRWRNLPAYQLERRADIFFAIYLSEILAHRFGVEIEGVIPEFPVRIGTIHESADINQSFKIDYLAKADDGKTVLLVELKTDQGSRRDKQDWYLERAKQAGLVELLGGLRLIYKATNKKEKYEFLLKTLQDMGFITLADRREFSIVQADYEIQVIYIQPNNPEGGENIITFKEISAILAQHSDELSQRFSQSLLKWASTEAGNL